MNRTTITIVLNCFLGLGAVTTQIISLMFTFPTAIQGPINFVCPLVFVVGELGAIAAWLSIPERKPFWDAKAEVKKYLEEP
jgi:hypothetical protein